MPPPLPSAGPFASARARLAALPPNLLASGLMILAFLTFSVMAVLVRDIGGRIPVYEMVFVRQVMSFIFMAPLFWQLRKSIGHPQKLNLHFIRGLTASGAMFCGLTAVLLIPLADATAIQMAEVLFATAFAAIFLKEKVGWRRWLATAVGFLGVIVMLRPLGGGIDLMAGIALVGALFGSINMIVLRMGAEYDRTETVLFWQGLVVLAIMGPVALWGWVTPTWHEAGVLFLMSVIFTLGMWLFTTGMRMGETSALAPLHYLRLLLMAIVGWIGYGETPTWATVIGALLVLSAATYTIRRNAVKHSIVKPREAALP
ncbi:MAG: DMT family transporter [Beijerinckiaceae bacterium]